MGVEENREAFLAVIRFCEGTDRYPEPYLVIFGGKHALDYSDHPANLGFKDWVHFLDHRWDPPRDNWSTASGAYQVISSTWNRLVEKLRLPDFSPGSQDKAALELVRERGALPDVDVAKVEDAVHKCSAEWASLPGSGAKQRVEAMGKILEKWKEAGGDVVPSSSIGGG